MSWLLFIQIVLLIAIIVGAVCVVLMCVSFVIDEHHKSKELNRWMRESGKYREFDSSSK